MKPKKFTLLTLAILTLITSFFWLFFSVYRVFTTKPAPVTPAEILEPVTPTLNKDAVAAIQARIYIEEP